MTCGSDVKTCEPHVIAFSHVWSHVATCGSHVTYMSFYNFSTIEATEAAK